MQTRQTAFDIAKGIGIILVVYGHALRGMKNASLNVPYFEELDALVYSFHMPLFFIVSGYFIGFSVNKKSARNLLGNKLHTLMYPYLVWMLIQGMIEFALSSHTNGNVGLWRVFEVWLPRAHFWFLYVLMLFSTLFIVAAKSHTKAPAVLFIISILLYAFPIEFDSRVYYLYLYVKDNLVFFLLGAMVPSLLAYLTKAKLQTALVLTGVSIFLQWLRLEHLSSTSTLMPLLHFVTALAAIGLVMQLSAQLSTYGHQFLLRLGQLSMPIYLAHIIFASGLRIVLVKLGIEHSWLHILAGTTVGIVGPIVLFALSKRLKLNPLFSSPFLKTAN